MHISRIAWSVAIVLLVLGVVGISQALGDEIVFEYSFEQPRISIFEHDGQQFHSLTMRGASVTGAPGQPALPAKGASILLPYGADIESIDVTASGEIVLGAGHFVEPCGYPRKLSEGSQEFRLPQPDPEIYESSNAFPASHYELVSIQNFRGFRIAVLKLHPVRFIGATGELYFSDNLAVRVNTVPSGQVADLFRGLPQDAEEVRTAVDNPDMIETYPLNSQSPDDQFSLLIVTRDHLVDAFALLKDYHDSTGISTQIRTTESDVGSTDPTDVRDYIREQYLLNGIEYVIIGGDDEILPAVDLYLHCWGYIEEQMPGDLYFGCLDGTYNYDGDDHWGEPTDGEGGGEVDLLSEVHVGRACVFSLIEADRFVNKTIQYLETRNSPYLRRVLLTGENLAYPDMKRYGGDALDLIADGSSDNGYTTVGIPGDLYTIDRLYDRDWPGGDWPASEAVARINAGRHIINHLGHSNYEYSLKLYQYQLDQLTSSDLCFMYNEGCQTGWYDGYDCWAEQLTVKMDCGAFAAIGNARYGWVEGFLDTDRSDGPSNRFNREFWDAVFNPDENMPELGRANSDSRHDNIWRIDFGANRCVAYGLILFGDPTVALKRPGSLAFEFPNGLPEIANPGESLVLDVEITGVNGGESVPGSETVYYSIDGGEYQTLQLTQKPSDLYGATLPALECGQKIEYYFGADEATYGEYFDCDPECPHQTTAALEITTLFEDDFEEDLGWTISGGLWQRGVPTGQGGVHTSPDPTSGSNGANVYGYNLNGDYENDLPETHLTSPVIDCSRFRNVHLRFSRWLGVEQSRFDHASVRVSVDGETWDTIWQNISAVADKEWIDVNFDLSDIADNQETVRLRWTMGETSDSMTYCGWNIDDVRLVSYNCFDFICGDADGSGEVDIDDVVYLIAFIFSGGPSPDPYESGDADCSGEVDIDDVVYLITYIFSGGNAPCDVDGDGEPDC